MEYVATLSLTVFLFAYATTAIAECRGVAQLGELEIDLEFAADQETRAKGLMHRTDLAWNEGMLFVYPHDRELAFWMKNTPLPLDILFYDAKGNLQNVQENTKPFDETPLPGHGALVLEVNAGVYAKNPEQFSELKLKVDDNQSCPEIIGEFAKHLE